MSRKPLVTRTNKPGDYSHGLSRGTVDFREDWRNYSFHHVSIPSGTTVRNCNFTQTKPKTEAVIVTGDPKTVTFEDCNLTNVAIKSGWTVRRCNTSQSWLVPETDENGEPTGDETRRFVASHPDDIDGDPVEPDDAITTRNE